MEKRGASADVETVRRLREFFEIASLKCSCCDALGQITLDTGRRIVTRTPAHYGIHNIADWHRKMDEGMTWARDNKEAVLAAMADLSDWPEMCAATREVLESS